MNLKTSLSKGPVSGALLKSNLRTHWVWPVIMSVLLSFNVLAVRDSVRSPSFSDLPNFLYYFIFAYIIGVIFSIMTAAKMFMYLDKPNSVSFMHGVPLSRLKLYVTNLLSGGIIVVIPPLVSVVLMLGLQLTVASRGFTLYRCLAFFASYMIYSLIAYAITVFSMAFCGNTIVSLLLTCGIVGLPAAIIGFFLYVCYYSLYGYVVNEGTYHFLMKLYILPENLFSPDCLIYIIGAVVFLVLGYCIYAVRPLENCGEVVAFRKLRMLFTIVVAVVMGMISYMFFSGFFNINSLLCMLPLGLLGVIGANMIARKTVGLRGCGIHVFIYVLLTVLGSVVLSSGGFGYVTRVPDVTSVESVTFDTSLFNGADVRLTDPEDIELVRELHSALTKQSPDRNDYVSSDGVRTYHYASIWLTYKLKNGTSLQRSYDLISSENYKKYALSLLELDSVRLSAYPFFADDAELIETTIFDDRISTEARSFSGAEQAVLCDAVRRDILSLSADSYDNDTNGALRLRFRYTYKNEENQGTAIASSNGGYDVVRNDEEYVRTYYHSIYLNEEYTETLAALKELGYDVYNSEEFESIEKAVVWLHAYVDENDTVATEDAEIITRDYTTPLPAELEDYFGNDGQLLAVVTDKVDIRTLYDYIGFGYQYGLEKYGYSYYQVEICFTDGGNNPIYSTWTTFYDAALADNLRPYFALSEKT